MGLSAPFAGAWLSAPVCVLGRRVDTGSLDALRFQTLVTCTQWLEIKPTDDDKKRAKKRKLQKSFKSKLRFQKLDLETKARQQSWLDFKRGKGARKKVRVVVASATFKMRFTSHLEGGTRWDRMFLITVYSTRIDSCMHVLQPQQSVWKLLMLVANPWIVP